MFDINQFKRDVKEWIKSHPQGEEQDLIDFCEELIPASQFAANQWLVDQTVSWFRHILSHQETKKMFSHGFEE